jgi:hypothetical protein
MKKDAFYFSHDYNAHNDVKILYMRHQLGMEGYGIYWFLIESLADAGGFLPLDLIPVLAAQMQSSDAKVNAIVTKFDLFQILENQFFSVRLNNHLEVRHTLSEYGKKGALARWNKDKNGGAIGDANAKERKGKEIKGKEIKVKESILNPPLGKKYLNTDFQDLPENYYRSIIEQMFILKQKRIDDDTIFKLWEAFKLELTGVKWYNSEDEVYKHFCNWIKSQKFIEGDKTNSEKRKDLMHEYLNRPRDYFNKP